MFCLVKTRALYYFMCKKREREREREGERALASMESSLGGGLICYYLENLFTFIDVFRLA